MTRSSRIGRRAFAVSTATLMLLLLGCAHHCIHAGVETHSPVLDRILARGELVVGTAGSMPPLNMTTRDGRIIGLEPDLAEYLALSMGVELRLEKSQFSELLDALANGKVDMVISAMTITPERNLRFAFAGPYFVSGKCVLTKIDALASTESASDINRADLTITALKGSTSEAFVEAMIPAARLDPAPDYDVGVSRVLTGKADAMVADYPICLVTHARNPNSGLVSVITRLTYEPLGIALPASDPLLLNFVDNLLQGLAITGRLDQLQEQWFENTSWIEQLP
jgi:polar amino acid transport system substrate-binding protein